LSSKLGIYDTCGVGNLHGYPSVVGGLLSIYFVMIDSQAEFLQYKVVSQMFRQLGGVLVTLAVAMVSGYGTGVVVRPLKDDKTPSYVDSAFWHSEYFEKED
jgi:ammonium transporter Rh